jgi:hypothetical protein
MAHRALEVAAWQSARSWLSLPIIGSHTTKPLRSRGNSSCSLRTTPCP